MKVKFYYETGYVGCGQNEIVDLEDDYGISDEEWAEMDDEAKAELVREWMMNDGFDFGWIDNES